MKFFIAFRNSFTIKGIYNNRKVGLFRGFFHIVVMTLMIYFPLALTWANKTTLDYERYGLQFASEVPSWFSEDLPDCYFLSQQFFCDSDTETLTYKTYTIHFLSDSDEPNQIIFLKDYFKMNIGSSTFHFRYTGFSDFHFSDLNELEEPVAAKFILDSMFVSIKDYAYLPLMLFIYFAFIVMNLIYLLLLASISMSFKFKISDFPKYKEVITMFFYATSIPSLVSLVIVSLGGAYAFVPLIYNFTTPIVMFFVYRREIAKS